MVGILRAQPGEAVLVDRYGAIRADMVRDICTLTGVSDSALIKTIENRSLKSFKERIKNDTLKIIVSKAKSLSGLDIDKYINNLRETRRDILYSFSIYYPEKESEAEDLFSKYHKRIIDVTNEFRLSKPETRKDEIKSRSNLLPTETADKPIVEKKGKAIKMPYLIRIIVGLAFILATIIVLSKRNRWVSKANKVVDGNMEKPFKNNEESPLISAFPSNQEQNIPVESLTNLTEEETKFEDTKPEEEIQRKECGGNSIAVDTDEWIVVGASVQGNGHVEMEVPCQDSHTYEYLYGGWGIAIVSDGAGSAKLSHKGSAAVVARALFHFKSLIMQEKWIEKNMLPSDGEWMRKSYQVLKKVHNEICSLAQHLDCEPKDLNATIIVVIHSPLGLLTVHVGDGRAGYKDLDGNWHKLMTPHKGEEANQTIFMMSEFWNIPFYEMSGVMVPESVVINKPVTAFTLMSDGCESTSWLCNQYNEDTGKYYDPNVPYAKFFNSLIETLYSFREENVSKEERKEKWFNFIKSGNKSFIKETDDKTMVLATFYNKQK